MLARLSGAVLIGGRSERMGRPKQLLPWRGRTLLDHLVEQLGTATDEVVLVGGGQVPPSCSGLERLADVPGRPGPLGGLLALLRSRPGSAWLVAACDLPQLALPALRWLIAQRREGVPAIFPESRPGRVEPLLAIYEPAALALLERLAERPGAGPRELAREQSVPRVAVPAELRPSWRNANTPEELAALGA